MPAQEASRRSYGCSYGCGNPYDFIIVQVGEKEVLMLCTPCFIQTGAQMLEAMANPDNETVRKMLAEAPDASDQVPFEDRVPGYGHNAPVETKDPDAIDAFEAFILEDELPDGFR